MSLAIMGIALAMVMESFTTSMKGARNATAVTTASVLARDLIEQWELTPPELGENTGNFGEDHPGYTYKVRYEQVEMDYDDVDPPEEGRLEYLRRITLDVYYQSSSSKTTPKRVLHVETALTSGERFSEQGRASSTRSGSINRKGAPGDSPAMIRRFGNPAHSPLCRPARRPGAGFTLLEVLVAVAIFSVSTTALVISFQTATKSFASGRRTTETMQTLRFVVEHISRDLRAVYYDTDYNKRFTDMRSRGVREKNCSSN